MKVILLTDIPKIGNKYDVKDFKEGYAQNVLLSKGLAELATPQALNKLEARKMDMKKKAEEESKAFDDLISNISNTTIKVLVKANEKGHLFKSVSPKDVILAIKEASGVQVDENLLSMDHIKEIGIHTVTIKKGNKQGQAKILVEAE